MTLAIVDKRHKYILCLKKMVIIKLICLIRITIQNKKEEGNLGVFCVRLNRIR